MPHKKLRKRLSTITFRQRVAVRAGLKSLYARALLAEPRSTGDEETWTTLAAKSPLGNRG